MKLLYPVVSQLIVSLPALLYVYKKKKTSRHDILLLGLCESGKTKLYSLLMKIGEKETFTSIKENVGEYAAKNVSERLNLSL